MTLTDKKRRFVDALLSGATNREAAIAAGYSEKTASQAGSKLAKDPAILSSIGHRLQQKQASSSEVKRSQKVKGDAPEVEGTAEVQLTQTDDPRAFLTEVMNADQVDLRMRMEAAKTLMPYSHGKVADQGKKEQKADAAKEAGKGKYSQGRAPLSVVKG